LTSWKRAFQTQRAMDPQRPEARLPAHEVRADLPLAQEWFNVLRADLKRR
jgi:hypothetical protein